MILFSSLHYKSNNCILTVYQSESKIKTWLLRTKHMFMKVLMQNEILKFTILQIWKHNWTVCTILMTKWYKHDAIRTIFNYLNINNLYVLNFICNKVIPGPNWSLFELDTRDFGKIQTLCTPRESCFLG